MHSLSTHQSQRTPGRHREHAVRERQGRERERWPCIGERKRPVTAGLTALLLFQRVGVCHYQHLCVCQHNTSQGPMEHRDAKKTLAGVCVSVRVLGSFMPVGTET